jgi:hypothetical protein
MAAIAGQPRAAVLPARGAYTFELVMVVRQLKPAALIECWDCGGTLTSGDGQGFLCTICSSRWRSRWTPCPWCGFSPSGAGGNAIASNVRSPSH